jgi:hypothetical protein
MRFKVSPSWKLAATFVVIIFPLFIPLLQHKPSSAVGIFLSSLIFLEHGRWTKLQPACHPPKGYIGRQANHKTMVIWTSPDSRQRSAMCLPMSVPLQDPVRQVSWIYYWLDYYSNRNCQIPGRRNYLPRTIQKKMFKDEYIFFHQ